MSSKYQMWLTYNGGAEKFRFPVLPEVINIKDGASNTSVNIQGLGEVVIKQDPTAVIVSFSSFFPAVPFPGVQVDSLTPPAEIKSKITTWQKGDMPSQFIVTGTAINSFFAIEDFTCRERGGDIGTLHYSIILKEYKEVHVRQVKVAGQAATLPASAPARVDNRATGKTHTVVKGDSLWVISARLLGSGSRYTEIYELNRSIIKNPNLIFPGQVLKLPA